MGEVIEFPTQAVRNSRAVGLPVGSDLPWYLLPIQQETQARVGGESYRGRVAVALDFETTSRGYGDSREASNRIVLACIRDAHSARCVTLDELRDILSEADVLIAHNAKFELSWLRREGLPWEHLLIWDTMLAERVKHGNILVPVNLGACCERYGLPTKDPLVDSLIKGGVCPSEIPRHLLEARCLRDVETTYTLAKMQLRALSREQRNVVFTRCVFTPVLAEIESAGMQLDSARVYAEYARVNERFIALERELDLLAQGRNLNSPVQIAEVLYDILKFPVPKKHGKPLLTASGKRPTDKATLQYLRPKTKKQKRFLELKTEHGKMRARLTKVLNFFKAVCDENGGHFYGHFHQTRTATHRTSSTSIRMKFSGLKQEIGVQLQNLPREYKYLFTSPDPDYVVVEVDGSQLEFVVAGYLGQDPQVCHDVTHGEDIHRYTASVLFSKPEASIVAKERTEAKKDTFKPLYGGQSGTEQQVAYYKAFRQKYNCVYRTQMGWLAKVLKDKEISMPWGMTFYFPNARLRADGYCPDMPSIFNYPVQNLATAEIIPVSLTFLFWRCKLEGVRVKLVNTIHDSVVALVHKDDVEKFKAIAKRAFLKDTYRYLEAVYGINFNLPLGVGFKVGTHWGEGVEEKCMAPLPTGILKAVLTS